MGPWLLVHKLGSPGPVKSFAALGSCSDIKGTTLAESSPESLSSGPREAGSMQIWAGPKPGWLRGRGPQFALVSRCQRVQEAFSVARQGYSAKASLAVVSFAGNPKRVL